MILVPLVASLPLIRLPLSTPMAAELAQYSLVCVCQGTNTYDGFHVLEQTIRFKLFEEACHAVLKPITRTKKGVNGGSVRELII